MQESVLCLCSVPRRNQTQAGSLAEGTSTHWGILLAPHTLCFSDRISHLDPGLINYSKEVCH